MKYCKSFCILLLFFVTINPRLVAQQAAGGGSSSQPQGIILGSVTDKKTGHPVEYANVVLYRVKDSALVTGVVTDSKGIFRLEKIQFGNFYVKVNFIGYKVAELGDIQLRPETPIKNLGEILLEVTSTRLEGATITAEREQMEYNLDKKVVNVDKNLSLAGGSAIEVMQTIPSVTVDVEGNVSLRGSSNVTILVDGRPSNFTSLDQLPASMIERVEVVTNPSARYDPDGMSGIINIVLKKKKEPGYNGMISLNAGTGDKYMGSLNLNYRYNKINVFTNYDLRYFSMKGSSENHRESWFNDTSSFLDQFNTSRNRGKFHNIKAGVDYFINDFNTLSVSGSYHFRAMRSSNVYKNAGLDWQEVMTNYYERVSDGINSSDGYEAAVNYKKTFEQKGREWTIDASYEKHDNESGQDMRLQYYDMNYVGIDETEYQESSTINDNYELQFRTDYVHPLGKGRIEAGYKFDYNSNDQDYLISELDAMNNWVVDENTSNQFIYQEQIHAAYAIYSNSIKKFKYQAGLRLEESFSAGNQVTQNMKFTKARFGWFPTVHLKYEFNDHHDMQLSYSRRVRRPRLWNLNPFTNYSDPMNLSTGNPYLDPEYTNSLELGYDFAREGTNINTSLFYRQTTGIMSRVTTLDSTGVSHTTWENLNNGTSYGLELVFGQKLFKWWKINASGSFFHQQFEGDQVNEQARSSNSWTGKVNSAFTPMKGFDIQLSFFYNSPVVSASGASDRFFSGGGGAGKMAENYWADLGMRKDFLKGALSLSLRVQDLFKTQKYNSWSWGDNYETTTQRYRESRVLFLGLTYKINGGVKNKRRVDNGDEEMEF